LEIPRLLGEEPIEMGWSGLPGHLQSSHGQFVRDFTSTPAQARLRAGELDAVRKILSQTIEAKQKAHTLIGLHAGRAVAIKRPIILNVPCEVSVRLTAVAKFLRLCAIYEAIEGNADQAINYSRAIVAVAWAVPQPAMLFTALSSMSSRNALATSIVRSLALCEPSPAVLAAVQNDVQQLLDEPLLLNGLRGERAILDDTMACLADGTITDADLEEMQRKIERHWFTRGIFRRFKRWLLGSPSEALQSARNARFYTSIIELLRESPDALKSNPRQMQALRKKSQHRDRDAFRWTQLVIHADWRQRAMLNTVVLAIAAERFRQDNRRWPRIQDELVPQYLRAMTTNPHTLMSLSYAQVPGGIEIAAVGRDRMRISGMVPKVRGHTEGSIRLRLWDADLRREAP
jgi:hypothetical protein